MRPERFWIALTPKSPVRRWRAGLESFDRKRADLTPGTVLVREWDRQSHRVMVLADGFAWNGRTYDSLTKVAFAITGTRWNGPRFFGLRDKQAKPASGGQAMKPTSVKTVRCAIYTRVSTDQGLDQEFNSLDAQYDASSAYIKSQAHAGWTLIKARYDDGGYSGGSTDRPDLQRLLDDIRARKIDVIVVYKVDRLTRSLADFAKLVELFDAHGVSFVSVTQQFNTTTSMGRLTLNVLLSFAQFEREVTSERIRDKIAASKRKGIWVGGPLPLGYDMKDGKIVVVEEEAEQVRLIFRRYLELSGVNALVRDLRERNIRTKTRLLATGGDPWWHPVRAGNAVLPPAQPVLYRRGQHIKVRSCPASSPDHGSRPVRCGPAEADGSMDRQDQRPESQATIYWPGCCSTTRAIPWCRRMRPRPASVIATMCRDRACTERPRRRRSDRLPAFLQPRSRRSSSNPSTSISEAESGMPAEPKTGHSAIAEVIDRIDVHKDRLTVRLRSQTNPETMKRQTTSNSSRRSPPVHSLAEAAVQTIPGNPVASWLVAKGRSAGDDRNDASAGKRYRARQALARRNHLRIRHRC